MFLLLIAAMMMLVACGQGQGAIDPAENETSIDTDQNDEMVEQNGPEEPNGQDEPETNPEVKEEPTVHPVELFFADTDVMDMYRVETTVEAENEEVFKKTLEAWVAGPKHEDLISLIPPDVQVQSVEEKDGVAHVSFSSEILAANVGSGAEEMILQQIALTMKQFGFHHTQVLVDGEILPTFFGHMDTDSPIEADNPENYEKK